MGWDGMGERGASVLENDQVAEQGLGPGLDASIWWWRDGVEGVFRPQAGESPSQDSTLDILARAFGDNFR
jgi:hypothetical protein